MTTHDTRLMTEAAARAIGPAFAHVEAWVFDLDNTLYPPDSDLWPQIDARITAYIMDLYGLDGLGARALQKHFYERHGTTLKALLDLGHAEPEAFMDFVHDIDRSRLPVNGGLSAAIGRLPGRKLILTNGSQKHAEATAGALGILDHFEGIFDIKASGYVPKPARAAYDKFFMKHGVDPRRSAMFEDLVKNLKAPHEAGMKTVLITARRDAVDLRDEWERRQETPAFIDFVTDDLTYFLASAVA
jgi:putative hydrolase of the HAD superfamily